MASFTKLFFSSTVTVAIALAVGSTTYVYLKLQQQDTAVNGRLANVRLLPAEVRSTAVRIFAEKITTERPVIVLLGDSQMFGHGYSFPYTFGARLRELMPGGSIYNLSVVDGRFDDFERAVKILVALGLKPDVIITNVNPSHLVPGELPRHLPDSSPGNFFLKLMLTTETAFFANPVALARLNLFEERTVDQRFNFAAAGPDYYKGVDGKVRERDFRSYLATAVSAASRVVIFASPNAHRVYTRAPYNYDWKPNDVARYLVSVCREYKAECWDLSESLPEDRFFDVIHLNARGHREFAEMLAKLVRNKPPQRSTP